VLCVVSSFVVCAFALVACTASSDAGRISSFPTRTHPPSTCVTCLLYRQLYHRHVYSIARASLPLDAAQPQHCTIRCSSLSHSDAPQPCPAAAAMCSLLFIVTCWLLLCSSHWQQAYSQQHNAHVTATAKSTAAAAGSSNPWLPAPWVGQPPALDPLACTPQLLIIGAMKGGTTALFHYLNGSQPAVHYPNGSKSHVESSFRPRCGSMERDHRDALPQQSTLSHHDKQQHTCYRLDEAGGCVAARA
jgi:hypothetical protein